MSFPNSPSPPAGGGSRGLVIAVAFAVLAAICWAAFSTWTEIAAVGRGALMALWTLPFAIALHLVQLFLSSAAWRTIFTRPRPSRATFFRLRLIREGIDSLFPVAQVGGEVVGARLLARAGVPTAMAGASVVVDLTLEVLSQAAFLILGLAVLGASYGAGHFAQWTGTLAAVAVIAAILLLGQRLGLLRLLEFLVQKIEDRFPAFAGLSLAGLHQAAKDFYGRRRAMLKAFLIHLASWALGTVETWFMLRALHAPASFPQAFVIESLGMAARSAGFAVPGALAVQEGGFMLAAASVGLPDTAGLSLSFVKRAREVIVGIAGVLLARRSGGLTSPAGT